MNMKADHHNKIPVPVTLDLFQNEEYPSGSSAYLNAATAGARKAIQNWLGRLERGPMYLFEVAGTECALEFFTGHWEGVAPYGMVKGGRWRWGRIDAGDPDADESGEDILLDVALGRTPAPGKRGNRRRALSPYSDSDLTQVEIEAHALARAEENLEKLALHKMP
jgi:hypothetical protein